MWPQGEPDRICRCVVCGRSYKAGWQSRWFNHFYCSGECGYESSKYGRCEGNRNCSDPENLEED